VKLFSDVSRASGGRFLSLGRDAVAELGKVMVAGRLLRLPLLSLPSFFAGGFGVQEFVAPCPLDRLQRESTTSRNGWPQKGAERLAPWWRSSPRSVPRTQARRLELLNLAGGRERLCPLWWLRFRSSE
jgi:hypothetical protein